jgi:hypothetical protein
MGYYINPKSSTKEQWLAQHGQPITLGDAKVHPAGDLVVVCLVDNGPFTAAGICYCDAERDMFVILDGRPKLWFLVSRELLVQSGFLK